MTDIQKEVLDLKQTKLDLIESGIIRAASALINESADAANDGRLTLAKVTILVNRLDEILTAYSDAKTIWTAIKTISHNRLRTSSRHKEIT